MFNVQVTSSFRATHAVTIQGIDETPHEHDWKVEVVISGNELDSDGLLVDFIDIEKKLGEVIAPFENADLNCVDVLDGVNPSTEHVARYIGNEMSNRMDQTCRLESVTVTEAPNCKASYMP
jgi:6-pyruvoyltetrahydropterin/6-carboxytetrahydropterin synthase